MPDQPTAVLLLAHGTPDRLSEMAEYLAHVTAGRPMPAHVVEELQHRYAAIGLRDEPLKDGPPLTRWTLRQGELLSQSLGRKVYVAMRNWLCLKLPAPPSPSTSSPAGLVSRCSHKPSPRILPSRSPPPAMPTPPLRCSSPLTQSPAEQS